MAEKMQMFAKAIGLFFPYLSLRIPPPRIEISPKNRRVIAFNDANYALKAGKTY
jgi:hypothetical protein